MWNNHFTIKNQIMGELTTGALFFGIRSCEYLSINGDRKTKLLHIKNLRFYKQRKEINKSQHATELFQATTISITFESQKNDQKDESVTMHANNKELCPVRAWATISNRILQYPGASIHSPVNMMLIKEQITLVHPKDVLQHVRATVDAIGRDILGFGPEECGVHSIRSSFAMFLYTEFVRTDKIMLQGRWRSDAFLIYIRRQVKEGLSSLMINSSNEYFTVPELQRECIQDLVTNPDDPRTRHLFSFASSLNNNGPGSNNGAQTIRPSFHLWS